jgi:hypothetical protein
VSLKTKGVSLVAACEVIQNTLLANHGVLISTSASASSRSWVVVGGMKAVLN